MTRDHEDERERVRQQGALNRERSNGHSRRSFWTRVAAGVLLGSFFYLVTSCYFEQRLHQPKLERGRNQQ